MSNVSKPLVIDTPEGIEALAVWTARESMRMWVESGGKMRLTRIATPAYIAWRFKLADKKGKVPKTAKACLKLLDKKVEEYNKQQAERAVQAAVPLVVDKLPSNN